MFKKPRRVPRKIERDDELEDGQSAKQASDETADGQPSTPSVVKRPTIQSKLAKAKKSRPSAGRTSFAPDEVLDAADAPSAEDAFAAVERKRAALQSNRASLATSRLPYRSPDASETRPAYDAAYLATLRDEQQTAPPPRDALDDAAAETVDIAAKFGANYPSSLTRAADAASPAIPTDAEIREKKERRRRLAQSHKADDFISLNDNDASDASSARDSADSGASSTRKAPLILTAEERVRPPKYGRESRLGDAPLDDDDFAEGFDTFVEDAGRVALGRAGLAAQEAQRRADMAAQIRGAEGAGPDDDDADDDDDEDPEERARLRAYEAAQTRHGTYGERHTASGRTNPDRAREERWRRIVEREYRPRALPDLKTAVARVKARVAQQGERRRGAEEALAAIRTERDEIVAEEARVQRLVDEAAEKLRRVTAERGEKAPVRIEAGEAVRQGEVADGERREEDTRADEGEDEGEDEDEGNGGGGLGFGNAVSKSSVHAGLAGAGSLADRPTSFGGMAAPPSPEW